MNNNQQEAGWRTSCRFWGVWMRNQGALLFSQGAELAIVAGVAIEGLGVTGQLNEEGDAFVPAGAPGSIPYMASYAGMTGIALGSAVALSGLGLNLVGRILCPCLPDEAPVSPSDRELEMLRLRVDLEKTMLKRDILQLSQPPQAGDEGSLLRRRHGGEGVSEPAPATSDVSLGIDGGDALSERTPLLGSRH